MSTLTRALLGLSAAATAVDTALLAAPGDVIPTVALVIAGAVTAGVVAFVAVFAGKS